MVKKSHRGIKGKRDGFIRIFIILIIALLASLTVILLLIPGRPDSQPASSTYNERKTEPELPEEEKQDPEELSAPRPPDPVERPQLIVVIDDVGYNLEGLHRFLEIPVPISFAVLPQLAYSRESAELITEAGQELILHLPMESQTGQDPGPGTLSADMSRPELQSLLNKNMATVPGITGLNNHMGSKGTEDERIVATVLEHAKQNSLFFLDSRTTAGTVIPDLVDNYDIPFIERDVFLDNSREKSYIIEALEKGKTIAGRQGHAVLIGHVWTDALAEILLEHYDSIIEEGYDFTTLAAIALGDG